MTTTAIVTLVHIDCGVKGCGIVFGIPDWLHRNMREKGWSVHCPYGHYIGYDTNEVQTLKDDLARERAQHDQTRAALADKERARKHHENRARVLKGHHTRLKRRVAHGVCPRCNRTFQNVARHMAGEHPGYVEAVGG